MSLNETEFQQFNKFMTSGVIACKICEHHLTTPIMLVDNIGNICNSCFTAEENAEKKWQGMRNEPGEKLLKGMKLACPNRTFGCDAMYFYENYPEHKSSCQFIMKRCPLSELDCSWQGKPEQFIHHFQEDHAEVFVEQEEDSKFVFRSDTIFQRDPVRLLFCEKYAIRFSITTSEFNRLRVILSNTLNNKAYEYKIKFRGMNDCSYFLDNCQVESLDSLYGERHQFAKFIKLDALKDILQTEDVTCVIKLKK